MISRPSWKPRPEPGARGLEVRAPLQALLASVVDYAGLFPPAGLDMTSAVRAYGRYRKSEHAWMLGAFVVRAERLAELAAAVEKRGAAGPWPVAALAQSFDEGFLRLDGPALVVRALEVAPREHEELRAAASDQGVRVYQELPLDDRLEARLDAIARADMAAKVRTGGERAEQFPSAERLADFIAGCAARGLPFKATAGLHHAVRGRYPLTYEKGSPKGAMFGFLDLALVSALVWLRRIDTKEAADLLREVDGDLEADRDGLRWSGYRLSTQEIGEVRRSFFHSFGSCSFAEPVADLGRMGLL